MCENDSIIGNWYEVSNIQYDVLRIFGLNVTCLFTHSFECFFIEKVGGNYHFDMIKVCTKCGVKRIKRDAFGKWVDYKTVSEKREEKIKNILK